MKFAQKYGHGLREILTRATVAKGQKNYRQRHVLLTDYKPDNILGYTCKNHMYAAEVYNDSVEVKGKYDVHIWYSFNNGCQTAVMKEVIHYTEYIPVVNLDGGRLGENEVAEVTVLRQPSIVDAYIKNSEEICVVVEMTFYADVIGDARLWVKTYEPPMQWDEKKYIEEDGDNYEFEFQDMEQFSLEEPTS